MRCGEKSSGTSLTPINDSSMRSPLPKVILSPTKYLSFVRSITAILAGNLIALGKPPKVDVAQIKLAAEFVTNNGGDIENAIASIEYVGEFITRCGNAAKAKAALEAYQSVAQLLK